MFVWIIIVIAILIGFYALVGRRMLCGTVAGKWFLDWIEPIEIALWQKSETLLWARFKMLMAFLLQLLPAVGAIDLSPVLIFVPDEYRLIVGAIPSIALFIDGLLGEVMRRYTTQPVAMVAVPENAPVEVRAALASANSAKETAVETVAVAKAEGTM